MFLSEEQFIVIQKLKQVFFFFTKTRLFHRNRQISFRQKVLIEKKVSLKEQVSSKETNFCQVFVRETNNCHKKSLCHRKSFPAPTKASIKEKQLLSQKQVDRNIICKDTVLSLTIDNCVKTTVYI